MERIVLAYSGGLDTSVAVRWLADKYNAEVVAVTMDLGQGKELDDIRERALGVGAVRAHVVDLREEFAQQYILPSLQAGAIYEDKYPLATALWDDLSSQRSWSRSPRLRTLESSRMGAPARGTTRCGWMSRLEPSTRPSGVVAPAREWGMTRPDEIALRP